MSYFTRELLKQDKQSKYATFVREDKEVLIHVWFYSDLWPFHVTTNNRIPHKFEAKMTLLEYFRQQFQPKTTTQIIKSFGDQCKEDSPEVLAFIDSLLHDLDTLHLPVFGTNGLPTQYESDSDLSVVKEYLPELLEFNLKPYMQQIDCYMEDAQKLLKQAIANRRYVTKNRSKKSIPKEKLVEPRITSQIALQQEQIMPQSTTEQPTQINYGLFGPQPIPPTNE